MRQISLCISQDVRVKSSSFSNVVLIASLIEFFWNIFNAELITFFNVSRPAINFDRNRLYKLETSIISVVYTNSIHSPVCHSAIILSNLFVEKRYDLSMFCLVSEYQNNPDHEGDICKI